MAEVRYRVWQFGKVAGEFATRSEVQKYIDRYEWDDTTTISVQEKRDGKWRKILTQC